MKIVFLLVGTEGRPKIINGDTIRYEQAASSGTDQSFIMVSEYLVSKGHDVTIVLEKTDNKTCRGVKYSDFKYENIGTEVDILITALWFDKYKDIPFKVKKGLIYWYHMAWVYCINEMIDFCNERSLKMGFVNVSKWAQNQNEWNISLGKSKIENTINTIIPNPIMTELIEEIEAEKNIQKVEKSSIFHAQYGRGGDVAYRSLKEMEWPDMHLFDYVNPANGTDKKTVFTKLLEADYFIYPLYHPNGCVYKDTFSCSVAEAIAAGVIVVTYPLGAIPEYFSDGCVFIDFPEEADMDKMLKEAVTCEAHYMGTTETVKNKILEIENTVGLKEKIRSTSKNSIKERFSIDVIGKEWENLINSF